MFKVLKCKRKKVSSIKVKYVVCFQVVYGTGAGYANTINQQWLLFHSYPVIVIQVAHTHWATQFSELSQDLSNIVICIFLWPEIR